ncbi:MAG: polysaccharide biosynthesis tyrosine autokinase [Rikenellaceae bacterium]
MNNKEKNYLTLRDVWEVFINNIWLFVASVIIALAVAIAYISITPPTFTRTASILIKSDQKGQSIASSGDIFEDIGLVKSYTDINNEIYVLGTSTFMEEVVKRLSLNYNYAVKFRGIRWVDIYNNTPFKVKVDSTLTNANISFLFKTDGKENFTLSEVVIEGDEQPQEIKGQYNEPIETPYGVFTIEKGIVTPKEVANNLYSFSKKTIVATANAYSAALRVELKSKEASIIDLSITLGSKEKASDILNTLISVYNESWIKDKNLVTLSTTNFINDRLSIIEQELGKVDQNISNYKSENLLPDVSTVTGMNLQSSNEILKKQIELNNQLSMAKYILQYIETESTSDQLIPVNSGIESTTINQQITSYNELLLKKNTLLANSSINHPVVAGLINDLNSLKRILILSANELIATLQLQIKNAQQEELQTRKKLSNNPNQELYLLSTGREQMIKEQLYLFLLQKREENELNQAFTAYNTKVLSLARGSDAPVAPQRKVIIALSLVIGIIAPIIFLIIKSGLNVTIESKSDLANTTIPLLGTIPQMGKKKLLKRDKEDQNIIILDNGRDITSESLRMIRTNLDFVIRVKNRCKLISITSYHPKSGKSFISLNLALSLASKSEKVLVVDADFRRGTLSKAVNNPKKGSVSYLNGRIENINETIVKGGVSNILDVLPMGVMPPNPTELLLTERFQRAITDLKAQYDYIIFDCPPIEIVPDAKIVEKYCDTTVFIIRAGLMDKRELPELQKFYDAQQVKNMSLVLNGVDLKKNSRYGYGKYGYGKYGGYGYGTKN